MRSPRLRERELGLGGRLAGVGGSDALPRVAEDFLGKEGRRPAQTLDCSRSEGDKAGPKRGPREAAGEGSRWGVSPTPRHQP